MIKVHYMQSTGMVREQLLSCDTEFFTSVDNVRWLKVSFVSITSMFGV